MVKTDISRKVGSRIVLERWQAPWSGSTVLLVFMHLLEAKVTGPWNPHGVSQMELVVKNPPANARDAKDMGLIPGSGRYPGEGNGNLLQYSCLENSMNRGAWWAAVPGTTELDIPEQLGTHNPYTLPLSPFKVCDYSSLCSSGHILYIWHICCSLLASRRQAKIRGKWFRQNHRTGYRLGAHTWDLNQEVVILGKGTWELCYLIGLELECQYKGETQEPHILTWLHVLSRLA